jgi:hypothetical protein
MPLRYNPLEDIFEFVSETSSGNIPSIENFWIVEVREITAAEDLAGELTLSNSEPTEPTKTIVQIIGGTVQEYGFDFIVTNDRLIWNGLAMETLIDQGDKIQITYPL